jgi:hypothetical protein
MRKLVGGREEGDMGSTDPKKDFFVSYTGADRAWGRTDGRPGPGGGMKRLELEGE